MTTRKPILVTGSHRSGTTWVGKMIAASPSIGYIHEPFNLHYRPGLCTVPFPCWFMYITQENEAPYYEPLKDTLAFRFHLGSEIPLLHCRSWQYIGRMLNTYKRWTMNRLRRATSLMKDPIALFSAEWLAERFDMNVIVLIRHPAAFANSIRRLNWTHDFSHFLRQPLLMRDHLAPFEAEITAFARQEHDILDQAILLWRIAHYMILKYRNRHEDWMFLRHEDIARDPLYHFEYLFKRCNVDFSKRVQSVIEDYSNPSNPVEAQEGHKFTKRNSRSLICSWKKHFTEAEIARIREGVKDISKEFYGEHEW